MPDHEEKKKLKAFKITPSSDSRFDVLYVLADKTWGAALSQVENSLDSQFCNDKPWKEIKCTVECVHLTQEEWDGICADTMESIN